MSSFSVENFSVRRTEKLSKAQINRRYQAYTGSLAVS